MSYSTIHPLSRLGNFPRVPYITNNAGSIVNYGERYRNGERISTGFVESTINQVISKRVVKKQQMQWPPEGAHLLLQVRTQVLNEEWDATFRAWCPADDDVTLRVEVQDAEGGWQEVVGQACIPQTTVLRFTATVTPGTATIKRYKWAFKDPLPTPAYPNIVIVPVLAGAHSNIQMHAYSQGIATQQAYAPTVQISFVEDCDLLVGSASVLICAPCPACLEQRDAWFVVGALAPTTRH